MKSFVRHHQPDFLEQNAAHWNQQWVALKTRTPGARFNWYRHQGTPVNQLLTPFLETQTQRHCSYCDAFPPRKGDSTIDHFRPKGNPLFYDRAYSWENLYHACGHCQEEKMEQYSDNLLCPDATDYTFDRYYKYNYSSHHIEINDTASVEDQLKALETRRIFNFNHEGQVIARRHAWERWVNLSETDRHVDDFPFRFLFL